MANSGPATSGNRSRASTNADQAPSLKLTTSDILAAVRSLCVDQLKPVGRLILKRVRERAAIAEAAALGVEEVDLDSIPRIDPKQLRRLCERCKELRVVPEEAKEYAALLSGRNLLFVDVASPVDLYPMEMWAELEAYIIGLGSDCRCLPGSRYDCAKVLMSRNLPCLEGYSLGKLCHIVQLSVSQKDLLGYRDGQLVPYHLSQQRAKELCAMNQAVFCSNVSKCARGVTKQVYVVRSWEELRNFLRQLLIEENGEVMLSTVKRLFKSRLNLELSETVLGHRRMVELLQDPRMRDICTVQGHRSGQMVVRYVDQSTCPVPLMPPGDFAPQYQQDSYEAYDAYQDYAACMPMTAEETMPLAPPPHILQHQQVQLPPPPPSVNAVCLSTTPTTGMASGSPSSSAGAPSLREAMPKLPSFPLQEDPTELWECVSPGTTPRGSLFSHCLALGAGAPVAEDEVDDDEPAALPIKQPSAASLFIHKVSESDLPSTTAESFCSGGRDDDLISLHTPIRNTFIDFRAFEEDGLRSGTAKRRTQSARSYTMSGSFSGGSAILV